METALRIGLILSGSVSPLLTFGWLWQIKEWRIDRLKEHMRAEGLLRQMWGTLRPLLFIAYAATLVIAALYKQETQHASTIVLFAYATLSLVQIGSRRQKMPVWTKKAILLTYIALLVNAVLAWRSPYAFAPVIVLLQPFILYGAWLLFFPLDSTLKKRIMNKARFLRSQHEDLIVIGITGSAGKTTTKELIAHLLQGESMTTTPAHVNTEMGVSKWLIQTLSQPKIPKILVVEMGAYRPGEIDLLCKIVQPTMGVVTYVGSQHIALFGSQERLQKTKGELVVALPTDGTAFLNADSKLCKELAVHAPCPVVTVGTGGHADIKAADVEEIPNGIAFKIANTAFSIPLHGTHNSTNVLLAIAVAKAVGMQEKTIADLLRSFSPPKHTFNVRTQGERTILDDTHNASPASFEAGIAWARNQPAKQKILLTSGLIELGENQDKIHTTLGALASPVFQRVIFLSKRNAKPFGYGYGKSVELYSIKKIAPIPEDALLVCVGRMSQATIDHILKG